MIKGTVVVYSIPACPHCRTAKATLAQRGLQYVDVDLERYPHLRPWLKEATGKTSVPQIFFNSRHIGGNSELQLLVSSMFEGNGVEDVGSALPCFGRHRLFLDFPAVFAGTDPLGVPARLLFFC